MFDKFEQPYFWDKRATAILNQNINYPEKINQYIIDRKIFIIDELIKKLKPFSITDAGSGVGSVSIPLARKYPKIDFYLVDFSRKNIETIIKKTLDIKNVIALKSDITSYIMYHSNFLFSFDVLCHLKFYKLYRAIELFHKVSERCYYVFHALEYTILPYYYFMFSKIFPQRIATNLSIKFAEKVEKGKLPLMRGLTE